MKFNKDMKLWKYLFGDWSKWKDVTCTESLGYIYIVQTRVEKRTHKRQLRTTKIWVDAPTKIKEIQDNIFPRTINK